MFALIADTETTGLISNRTIKLDRQPEITEFFGQLINLESGFVSRELDCLIKPSRPIPEELEVKVGITNKMVENCPPFAHFAPDIKELIEGSPLVIFHNVSFDKEMLDIEFERLGQIIDWPRRLCTVEATCYLKGYRLNLSALHELLFGEKFEGAHRARVDVNALTKCCIELYTRGIL